MFSHISSKLENATFSVYAKIIKFRQLPRHIAFIVDGNRTFSKKYNISLDEAYLNGVSAILLQIKCGRYLGIENLSFFLFSLFNLQRKADEIQPIFEAIAHLIDHISVNSYDCRYKFIGDIDKLPENFQLKCRQLEERTKSNKSTWVFLVVNYSAKAEMIDSSKAILQSFQSHNSVIRIGEKELDKLMYTNIADRFPPDFMIRTSSHRRCSDFYLWQCSRALIYFDDAFWPQFTEWSLLRAIFYFQTFNGRCK